MRPQTVLRLVALLVLLVPPPTLVAGTITGTVTTQAAAKHRRPPRYYLGPYRSGRGPNVREEGGPEEVVVFLEGIKGTFPPPTQGARMAQRGEAFVPRVLAVLQGTTVDFPNEDDFYHNVFSVVAGDRFDLGRYPEGKSARQTLSKPGLVVVRCEIHSGMKAYILVLSNPHFAVPDAEGGFTIPNVPAGDYVLKAWHPERGERSRPVMVPEAGTVTAGFAF